MDREELARERIDILFEQAEEEFKNHPERSHRYVEIARDIAMKFNISMRTELRERFCKDCYSYLVPGENARESVKDGKKIVECGECGNVMTRPIKRES